VLKDKLTVGVQVLGDNAFFSTVILDLESNLFVHFLICFYWKKPKMLENNGFFFFLCFIYREIVH